MAWLSGWAYRIELTIDSTKVDNDLVDFPVMIDVPAAVFNRFSADSDRKKIAVTTSDGTTQCYVEIEYWDHASQKGFLHTKIPSILAASDTTIYLYYDAAQSENTTYVGDTGNAAAQNVWDSDFALVYHCAQDPSGGSGCVLDSTSNANHGTPKQTDSLTHIDGLVGKAYQGDGGAGAYIEVPHHSSLEPTDITIQFIGKSRSADTQYLVDKKTGALGSAGSGAYLFGISSTSSTGLSFTISNGSSYSRLDSGTDSVFRNQDAWAQVDLVYDNKSPSDNEQSINVNTVEKNSTTTSIDMSGSSEILKIMNGHTDAKFVGDLCELRISAAARSDAWRKATYYTLFNTLLTYGSEEQGPLSTQSLTLTLYPAQALSDAVIIPLSTHSLSLTQHTLAGVGPTIPLNTLSLGLTQNAVVVRVEKILSTLSLMLAQYAPTIHADCNLALSLVGTLTLAFQAAFTSQVTTAKLGRFNFTGKRASASFTGKRAGASYMGKRARATFYVEEQ